MADDDLTERAAEVRKYWLDWPQERRDAVRKLSPFLADAIENLAAGLLHDPTPSDDAKQPEDFTLAELTMSPLQRAQAELEASRGEAAGLRAERDQFRDASVMYAAMVAERNAERDRLQGRIDAALRVCDGRDEYGRLMVGDVRRALADGAAPAGCQTPGAQFHIDVQPSRVSCVVDPPFVLDLTEAEAAELEQAVHDGMEAALAKYWRHEPAGDADRSS